MLGLNLKFWGMHVPKLTRSYHSWKGMSFSLWTCDHQTYLKGTPFCEQPHTWKLPFYSQSKQIHFVVYLLFSLWLDMGCNRVWSLLRRCGILLYNNNDFTQTCRLQRCPICSAKKNQDFNSTSLWLRQQSIQGPWQGVGNILLFRLESGS